MNKEEIISQNFETQIPIKEKGALLWQKTKDKVNNLPFKDKLPTSKNKKIALIIGIILFLMIIILVIISSTYRTSQFKPSILPSPSPNPYEEEIKNPSNYATDSAILGVEEKVKEINQELDQTDLKETGLNPPILDMEVNFEE